MRCIVPEISWHNKEPVLSIDVHPLRGLEMNVFRVATGGADNHVYIWQVSINDKETKPETKHDCMADLGRHNRSVNVVRWSPSGQYLASGDDDSYIIIWNQRIDVPVSEGQQESWVIHKVLRGHNEDVIDLCWSPCGSKLVSGSIDNMAIIWDTMTGKLEQTLFPHHGFVQGVAWDTKNDFVATISTDRTLRLFTIGGQLKYKMNKGLVPVSESHFLFNKEVKYFYDDTYKSFFRRMEFSPDGSFILVPSARLESANMNEVQEATLAFAKTDMPLPSFVVPHSRCSTCVRFCPILFKLREDAPAPYIDAPYRMVFGIGLEEGIAFYDTQQPTPFANVTGCHYTRLSDMSWSSDGLMCCVSSTDGYCTIVSFDPGELGEQYENKVLSTNFENTMESTNQKKNPMESTFLKQWAQGSHKAATIKPKVELDKENKGNISEVKQITVRRGLRFVPPSLFHFGNGSTTEENVIPSDGTKTSNDSKLTPIVKQEVLSFSGEEIPPSGSVTKIPIIKLEKLSPDSLIEDRTEEIIPSGDTKAPIIKLEQLSPDSLIEDRTEEIIPSGNTKTPIIKLEQLSPDSLIEDRTEEIIPSGDTKTPIIKLEKLSPDSLMEDIKGHIFPARTEETWDTETIVIKSEEVNSNTPTSNNDINSLLEFTETTGTVPDEDFAPLRIEQECPEPCIVIHSSSSEELVPSQKTPEVDTAPRGREIPSTKRKRVSPVTVVGSRSRDKDISIEEVSIILVDKESPNLKRQRVNEVIVIKSSSSEETVLSGEISQVNTDPSKSSSSKGKRVIQQTLPSLVKKRSQTETTPRKFGRKLENIRERKSIGDTPGTSGSTKEKHDVIDLTLGDGQEFGQEPDIISVHDQHINNPAPVTKPKSHRVPFVTLASPKRKTRQS